MKKLIVLLILTAVAGCNSGTGDDEDKGGDSGNTSGNGGSFKVFGTVKLTSAAGAGISGVTIKLAGTNTNLTASTGTDGSYSFNNIANGTYVVTATKANYTFVPSEAPVTVNGKDVAVQTFIGTVSGGTPGGNTGSGGSNTFLPLKLGAIWTYESIWDPDGLNSKSTVVEKIVGSKVVNGKTYWLQESAESSSEGGYADTTMVRVDGNIVYTFLSQDFMMKIAPKRAKAAFAAKAALDIAGSEIAIFKFGLSSGQTWSIYDWSAQGVTIKIGGKSLGTESISTPAGSFSGCAKIEITFDDTYKDSSGTFTSKTVSYIWFAPNVGMVKTSDTTTSQDGKDIITFKSSETLKSYTIP